MAGDGLILEGAASVASGILSCANGLLYAPFFINPARPIVERAEVFPVELTVRRTLCEEPTFAVAQA